MVSPSVGIHTYTHKYIHAYIHGTKTFWKNCIILFLNYFLNYFIIILLHTICNYYFLFSFWYKSAINTVFEQSNKPSIHVTISWVVNQTLKVLYKTYIRQ